MSEEILLSSFKISTVEMFVPIHPKFLINDKNISYAIFSELSTVLFVPSKIVKGTPITFKVKGIVRKGRILDNGYVVCNILVEFLVLTQN